MKKYYVLGVMSGTSLDGIDIAEITFKHTNKWAFRLGVCNTIPYSKIWIKKLKKAHTKSKKELKLLDVAYTNYLSKIINNFIQKHNIKNLDAICSHGHTILHEPQNGYTLQIGNLPDLAKLTQQNVVCNFRVQDVQLGGQGAPLVPIGDQLLFPDYKYCLNLGGFANISFQHKKNRIAFDNCPVNTVLNYYAQLLGKPYDNNGNFAKAGNLNTKLLRELNQLDYYKKKTPKSLGIEWVNSTIFPLLNTYSINPKDVLHTFSIHVATIIANDLNTYKSQPNFKLLITGGGAYNNFLIEKITELTDIIITIPDPKTIEFKEALIFGLLGVLKLNNNINTLSSVTGATNNHSAGNVFVYQNRTD